MTQKPEETIARLAEDGAVGIISTEIDENEEREIPFTSYNLAQRIYHALIAAQPAPEVSPEVAALVDDVSEYLHWRTVNKHITGGSDYLKRMAKALQPFTEKADA